MDSTEEEVLFDDSFKGKLSDINYHGACYDSTMVHKIEELKALIKNESRVVTKVFESRSAFVLQLFVQRIFAQKLEPRIGILLSASLSLSNLACVRMLYALHSLINQFVKDLSEFFQSLDSNTSEDLTSTLERCYSDLFAKTIFDRSKYFDLEKRSLENALALKTSTFGISHDKEISARALHNKLLNGNTLTHDIDLQEFNGALSGKLAFSNQQLSQESLGA